MKTSARFLAMLLAVVMIAGAALSVSAFDDVAGNKHANAINVLAQLDVIGGYGDGTFKPDQKVTRAEMAKLSHVLYTTFVDAGTGATAFSDVAADNWAAGYINWCSQMGIIGGYGDGKFGPNDNVTYDQALKMVCGVLGYNEWDSKLWPTDVRMKALRELELGEELDDVNGNDQLTRAQVAQIMYNALNKPMKETKTVPVQVPVAGPNNTTSYITMPQEVNKTLQADIWKITEVKVKAESVDVAKGTITLNADVNGKRTHKLADLGLEAYEGNKANALVGLELLGLKKTDKTELLGGLDVLGSVVDGVEVKYNKALDTLTVDGVAYKAVVKTDDSVDAEKTLKVDGATAFEKKTEGTKVTYVIKKAVKDALDAAFMARAIDVDGDAVIDELVIAPKTAVKVSSIGKTADKIVNLKTLKGANYEVDGKSYSPKAADITIEVAKDDVLVVATLGGIVYAEKVTPVETYATKLNSAAGKVTLANVGEVKFDSLTIAGVTPVDITTAMLGAKAATGYYVYNGEILLADDIKTASEYTFAILKEVEKTDGDELNEATMTYDTAYIATLIVDGKEVEVTLPATGTAIIDGESEITAADAAKAQAEGGYAEKKDGNTPVYKYALVAGYETDDDGFTVITLNKAFGEDDSLVEGTIAYDADKKLYTVGGNGKVVLDSDSVIFYTYEKEATGSFKHIGSYTKATITDKSFLPVDLNGKAYLAYNATAKTYTLLAAFVDSEIKGKSEDGLITYAEDGTLVLYAPENSNTVIGDDGEKYLEYLFLDNEKIENAAPVVSEKKANEATATVAGNFYAWNAETEKYVKVTANINTFKTVALKSIFENDGYILEFDSEMDSIAEDLTIWGLYTDEDGVEVLDEYKTLSVAELAEMLEAVAQYNKELLEDDNAENNDDVYTVNAILVRSEAEGHTVSNPKYDIESIIVEIYEENEDGELVSVNDLLFPELV